jgi:hypothetical protein
MEKPIIFLFLFNRNVALYICTRNTVEKYNERAVPVLHEKNDYSFNNPSITRYQTTYRIVVYDLTPYTAYSICCDIVYVVYY